MHAYDPSCYCCDCCQAEERVTAQIVAEERALREQRAAYVPAEPALRLALVTPSSGRR